MFKTKYNQVGPNTQIVLKKYLINLPHMTDFTFF